MCTWNYAYWKARRGGWSQIARDHHRFQRRIRETDEKISHVFSESHRQQIMEMLQSKCQNYE